MQKFQIHAIYRNLLDSKLICIDPLVMIMYIVQVLKDGKPFKALNVIKK